MKNVESKCDAKNQKGTYSDKIHTGELKTGPSNNHLYFAVTQEPQNLSGDKGLAGAKRIMSGKK
jgi:hypothetical protein